LRRFDLVQWKFAKNYTLLNPELHKTM